MTILLFGTGGQVGNALQRSLAFHGPATHHDRADTDLQDPAAIEAAISETAPSVIVNAAAYTSVDDAESHPDTAAAINRDAVATMAAAAMRTGALFIHYSTDYVFAGRGVTAYTTSDQPDPQNVYGVTKLAGEQAILASGCEALIFRTSWVYSAHGKNFVKTMLRLGQTRDTLRVVDDQVGAPTAADLIADVTSVALHAYRHGQLPGGLYHLSAAGETSWHGFATHILERARRNGVTLGVDPDRIEPIQTTAFPTPAPRPANSRLSNGTLETALGIHMPDWRFHANRVVDQLSKPIG